MKFLRQGIHRRTSRRLIQTCQLGIERLEDRRLLSGSPLQTAGSINDLNVLENAAPTLLGLSNLAYAPGPGELGPLTYTVTGVPDPSHGNIVLSDGVTAVAVNQSLTLAQLQGLEFAPAVGASDVTDTFGFDVQNASENTLAQSMTVTIAATLPPVQTAGAVNDLTVLQNSAATSLGFNSLTYAAGPGELGPLTFTVTAVPDPSIGSILLVSGTTAEGTPVVAVNDTLTLTQLQGLQFQPASQGPTGTDTFSFNVENAGEATLPQSITVTVAAESPPFLTGGTLNNLTVLENSAATSLGFTGLTYVPGPGEVGPLTFTATGVPDPSLGDIVLSDGTTVVVASQTLTLAQLQGLQFAPAAGATGTDTFGFSVQNAGGGTLAQSVTVTAAAQLPPVQSAGTINNLIVLENSSATSLGFASLNYAPGTGESGPLTYTVTAVPDAALGNIVLSDGTTVVTASETLTLAQLQGLQFLPAAGVSGGPDTFSFTVQDAGGNTLAQSITVTVAEQLPPVLTAGTINNLTVLESSAATSLGFGSLAYAAGAGESGPLTFTVAAVPPASLGNIVLSDGTTVVAANQTLTLAQLQGLEFLPAVGVTGGPGTFAFNVADAGGNLLGQSLTIMVVGQLPPVQTAGNINDFSVLENAAATPLGFSALSYAAGAGESGPLTYTVTAVPPASLGNVVLADGTTVVAASQTLTLEQLQGLQFAPAANVSGGPETFSFNVVDVGGNTLGQSITITVGT